MVTVDLGIASSCRALVSIDFNNSVFFSRSLQIIFRLLRQTRKLPSIRFQCVTTKLLTLSMLFYCCVATFVIMPERGLGACNKVAIITVTICRFEQFSEPTIILFAKLFFLRFFTRLHDSFLFISRLVNMVDILLCFREFFIFQSIQNENP